MFVAVLSDKPELRERFCRLAGKETGKGDISFYTANFQGRIITLVEPSLYPQKIQPLLYALSIADYAILEVDGLNQYVGEIIVALDLLKKEKGIIISSIPLPIKGTALEKYEKVETVEAAKEKLLALAPEPIPESPAFALIDSAFAVKSVGNVALGALKRGTIRKHGRFFILPEKKDIEIRSIQVQDKDVEEVGPGTRFGIAFKGELPERGILVPHTNEFELKDVLNGRFEKSPFYRDEIRGKMHAYSNFQFVGAAVSEGELKTEKPFASRKGEAILVCDPSNPRLRVAGIFTPTW
ncbi:MAG: hypothetical protein QXH30_02255 [Candidatus Bilamarchaeaceae archaeon]